MMSGIDLPLVYPITDRRLSGLTHAEQVERLHAGGATLIQLREKHLAPKEFLTEAREAVSVARKLGVTLIINDRVDLALAAGAHGVHLGQDDLPPEAARRLAGPDFIIGFSTHNLEQALAAVGEPVNYIAIGPVFPTGSKENPDPVVGMQGLARIREGIGPNIPLVAIGGITPANARNVIESGANSIAVISCLWTTPDSPVAQFKELSEQG
jgi:thiamine-phosphate pyrophosphorylase